MRPSSPITPRLEKIAFRGPHGVFFGKRHGVFFPYPFPAFQVSNFPRDVYSLKRRGARNFVGVPAVFLKEHRGVFFPCAWINSPVQGRFFYPAKFL